VMAKSIMPRILRSILIKGQQQQILAEGPS